MLTGKEDFMSRRTELTDVLRKLLPTHYENIINNMYSGNFSIDDIMNSIGDTEKKQLYTVQSPRDEKTNLVTVHYSLKEKMLSDLRSLRSKVKKQMEAATNPLDKNRYNSKQLAIKVMCNSEYGASNSSYFPYYDTLIGGATTAASRCLIGFLTDVLGADKLYTDKAFIDRNKEQLELLKRYKVLTYKEETIHNETEFVNTCRRHSLRILFDQYYNLINNKVWVIKIEPSRVVYQDTDSNYYTNAYIRGLMTENETPEIINTKMSLLMAHNKLIGDFIEKAIYRKPISVGFEGAFIVARYFNVKKKYYGVVWNDKMQSFMPPECYRDGVLIKDYSEYWKPAKTTYPLPNGDYIKINIDDLVHSNKDKLKMIKGQNIKCTGVDLARRDQYKFINANHIKVIQNDLHFLKYLGCNQWVDISNTNMLDIVIGLLKYFKAQFNQICKLVDDMINDRKPEYDHTKFYTLRDFAKDVSFKYLRCDSIRMISDDNTTQYVIEVEKRDGVDYYAVSLEDSRERLYLTRNEEGYYTNIASTTHKGRKANIEPSIDSTFSLRSIDNKNMLTEHENKYKIIYNDIKYEKEIKLMKTIGARLHKEIENKQTALGRKLTDTEFESSFPSAFKRKQYVVILTETVKRDRKKGKKTEGVDMCDKVFLIKEMHKEYRNKYPQEVYNKFKYHDMMTYDDFIDSVIISNLDIVHYVDAFCNSMTLYVMENLKDIVSNPSITEASPIANKKKAIAEELLIKVFPDRILKNKYKFQDSGSKHILSSRYGDKIRNSIKDVNKIFTPEEIEEVNKTIDRKIRLIPITEELKASMSKREKAFKKLVSDENILKTLGTNNFEWVAQRMRYLKARYDNDIKNITNKLFYMDASKPYITGDDEVTYITINSLPEEQKKTFNEYFGIGIAPKVDKYNQDYEHYTVRLNCLKKLLTFIEKLIETKA